VEKRGLGLSDLGSRNGTFVDDRRVVAVTVNCNQHIRFGSASFVLIGEDDSELEAETHRPMRGVPNDPSTLVDLSKAQRRVFDLLVTGLPEKAIAMRLGLSPHTVHNHVRKILRRFGVHARMELLAALLVTKRATRLR
jgi:DNA-binding NarL/FixJ family response regulator